MSERDNVFVGFQYMSKRFHSKEMWKKDHHIPENSKQDCQKFVLNPLKVSDFNLGFSRVILR